ncbi:DNA polymerase I, partial [candidate division WOR-3 bacterium]|nr:DNA polymerase I [candidate division WOR-3 bacterium]
MRIFLIDGSSLAYRGHFAFIRNPLRNSKGENTSAVFAFTNSIMKLLSEKKPEYILVAFDAPGPKHRHEKYEQYKAQRPKMPPELRQQIPIIKELLSAIGIRYYEETGLEADDIIGTFTKRGTEKGFEVTIFSDDKDFVQLLDDNVNILKPRDFKIYYKGNAKDWIGVIPEHVVDFLALTGDSIDNIPGIKGIGPKTAAALLEEYASLDGIYSNIDNIKKDKLKNLLIKEKDTAYLSRELAELEISENVPIDIK